MLSPNCVKRSEFPEQRQLGELWPRCSRINTQAAEKTPSGPGAGETAKSSWKNCGASGSDESRNR